MNMTGDCARAGEPLEAIAAEEAEQAPPVRDIDYRGAASGTVVVTERALASLASTRGWVMLWAVVLFISAGFSILGVLGILIAMAGSAPRLPGMLLFAVAYGLVAFAWIMMGVHLIRYASGIAATARSRSPEALERALASQKSFWRLSGIMLLVVIAFYFAIFMFAMLI